MTYLLALAAAQSVKPGGGAGLKEAEHPLPELGAFPDIYTNVTPFLTGGMENRIPT